MTKESIEVLALRALSVEDTLTLALEVLEEGRRYPRLKYEHLTYDKAITAIKEALANHIPDAENMVAQPKQEPVACVSLCVECTKRGDWVCAKAISSQRPSRSDMTWVGLTDEEIEQTVGFKKDSTASLVYFSIARAIEAKLKEKNFRRRKTHERT